MSESTIPSEIPSVVTGDQPFRVMSEFAPSGDQPKAIAQLSKGIDAGERFQELPRGRILQ